MILYICIYVDVLFFFFFLSSSYPSLHPILTATMILFTFSSSVHFAFFVFPLSLFGELIYLMGLTKVKYNHSLAREVIETGP